MAECQIHENYGECVYSGTDGSSECMCEEETAAVKQELAAMKAEMENRVDQLHLQLHYWQKVTVNILKDHYTSLDIRGNKPYTITSLTMLTVT